MLAVPNDSHEFASERRWDVRHELDGNDWQGILEVEWQGKPIHYCSFSIFNGMQGRSEVAMIATKSNAAMRNFHDALKIYGKERSTFHRDPHIIVANGEDIPIPKVSWDDLILPNGLAGEIRSNVEAFFSSRERYAELGIPYRRGFLFAGAAGCGKTMSIKALANTTTATFVAVLTKAGIDEDDLERAFHMARENAPAVLIIEDLDRLVKSRGISVSHFLNILDGLKVLDGVLVIATSNHPENLDPALLHRPSRFDRVWRFTLPNRAQRLSLLKNKGTRYFSPKALQLAAEQSNGFSMAYVQEIIVNALLECAHHDIMPTDEHLFDSLSILKTQRKNASKADEDMAEREGLGFAIPSQHPGLLGRRVLEREMASLESENESQEEDAED
jgi:SpoVK/Ycf46/Vps4 family AAA+-type ATPase